MKMVAGGETTFEVKYRTIFGKITTEDQRPWNKRGIPFNK